MLCYPCAEQGTDRPAVALCRSCNAGLCLGHLRATAAHFASSHMLDSCHHDTWMVARQRSGAEEGSGRRPPVGATAESVPVRRLLFVADAAVAEAAELPPAAREAIEAAAEVYVLTPALPGRLAWLADDVDRVRHVADERLATVLTHIRSFGVHASGVAGRDSVLIAIADAVADFRPDHILLALRSSEHANWQEHGLSQDITNCFGLPVTTYAIDPGGHVKSG